MGLNLYIITCERIYPSQDYFTGLSQKHISISQPVTHMIRLGWDVIQWDTVILCCRCYPLPASPIMQWQPKYKQEKRHVGFV